MAEQKLPPSAIPAKVEISESKLPKKRAVLYARVSTGDQHPETQLLDLRQMAKQRGYAIVREYVDTISGSKAKRPGLDRLLADARRHRFDVVLVAAFDRMARSTRHFLELLDELNHLGIEFDESKTTLGQAIPEAMGKQVIIELGHQASQDGTQIFNVVKSTAKV